jgi:hypothetical protein
MNIDLGSPVIDVAIGLSFVFFLLSLIVSAGTEVLSWGSKKRAADLEKGLRNLLGDETRAKAVLDHPLIQAGVKKPGSKPSYISPRNFGLAFLDVFAPAEGRKSVLTKAKEEVAKLSNDSPLKKQLTALIEGADGDIQKFRGSVEGWFNDTMDRVSGWYKRWSQVVALVLAAVVVIGLNVDAIRVTNRLADDQTVRSTVVTAAQQTVTNEPAPKQKSEESPKEAGKTAQAAVNELNGLNLPIGWSAANDHVNLVTVAGWLLAALAASFGAPFWFDALSKLARLRTTGAKPEPSSSS